MRFIKKLWVSFVLTMVTLTVCYAGSAESVNWQSDYATALKTAAATKKNVLLLFTGSDWCPDCKALEQQILSSVEFRKFTNENLVAVLADFPRTKKLPEEQAKANEALRKKFGVEGYPTLILLDANGNVLDKLGYSGQTPEAFVTELNRARMMIPRRNPVPVLEGKRASTEVIKFYDAIIFPPKGKSTDCRSYLQKNFDYYSRCLVTEPLKTGAVNQRTADWITAMLTNYCDQPGKRSIIEVEKSGREIYLQEGAAASPYFLVCYLWTVSNQDPKYRRILMSEALEKLSANKKLPLPLRVIYNRSTGRKNFQLIKQALASGELEQAHPQYIYRNLAETDDLAELQSILSMLEKSKIDPWVAKMMAGEIEFKIACDARGSGSAHTVTENGWKEFYTHGKLAYQYMEDAWKMNQKWPESAGKLVDVSCGLCDKDIMIQWFNRAVAAQIDYTLAYRYLFWGLLPRWGGSWHIMLAVGQKAADMDDAWYYTAAPLAFVWAVQNIAEEMDFVQRRAFLREQLPNVRRVLEKKIAASRQNNDQACAKHMYAILAKHLLLCGDYAEAKIALDNAAPDDNGYNYLIPLPCFANTRQEMELEIALATGSSAGIIRQVDAAIAAGEMEKAAKLYLNLITPASSTQERAFLEKHIERLFLINVQISESVDRGIFALARGGSIPGVRIFLDAKYDVNMRGIDNCTLLQRSLWLDWGLKLNNNPSAYAASKIAMLKFLMSRGADIHALAGPKWTAQHLAVSNKLPVQVLEFIAQQQGIDLNAGDVDMQTPLMWCAMLDLPKHAQFLIKQGADINRRDNSGKTALDYAKSDNMRQLLQDAAKTR